jgi:hypothetical protein
MNLPYVVTKFEKHKDLKQELLSLLDDEVGSSVDLDNIDKILKSDWYIDKNIKRKYLNFIFPHLHIHMINVYAEMGYDKFKYLEIWYQQYTKSNKHRWHQHLGCNWANVYYVELSDSGPRTMIKNPFSKQEIIIPELEEGDVLSFPAFFWHCSPENTSEDRKTVIAFNIDLL